MILKAMAVTGTMAPSTVTVTVFAGTMTFPHPVVSCRLRRLPLKNDGVTTNQSEGPSAGWLTQVSILWIVG